MGKIDIGTAVSAGVKSMTLEAVVIRADGTVENLGTIARSRQPGFLRRLLGRVKSWL